MNPVIVSVVEQHAEEAAFLWRLRDRVKLAPNYSLSDLARLDERVEAHVDGLRVAGDAGWNICKQAMEDCGTGEVFAAAILAFEYGPGARVKEVLETALPNTGAVRGLVSALGWMPSESGAWTHIKTLLASDTPNLLRVGIAAAAIRQRNPGLAALQAAFSSDDPPLKARSLRAVGELGLVDLHITTRANLKANDPASRFWAAWSTALMKGNLDAVAYLQGVAETGGPFAVRAAAMAMRCLPPRDGRAWLKRLVKELRRMRVAVDSAGALGDPEVIPFLIDQMKDPAMARLAGDSFSLITGAEITREHLSGVKPEAFDAGPNDDPEDENVAMDPDEGLPWPDPALVQKWWDARQGDFAKGTRYLLGRPITPDYLRQALMTGRQRQRAAAALELAIVEPGHPLFDVRAPGFRQ